MDAFRIGFDTRIRERRFTSAEQRPVLHAGSEVLEHSLSGADRAVDVFGRMGHRHERGLEL